MDILSKITFTNPGEAYYTFELPYDNYTVKTINIQGTNLHNLSLSGAASNIINDTVTYQSISINQDITSLGLSEKYIYLYFKFNGNSSTNSPFISSLDIDVISDLTTIQTQEVYNWKTDIYGNQYALLKPIEFKNVSIYDKKHKFTGSLWTRDARNIIKPATQSMVNVFNIIKPPEFDNNGINDIDIWIDTLMLYTSSGLYFYKLNFDYSENEIFSTSDEINYITTPESKFGGTWYHEEDKLVSICTLLSCDNQIRPVLRQLNLDTNELYTLYDIENTLTNMSSYSFTEYEHPVFTYDQRTNIYNISYIAYNDTKEGMYLTSINIKNNGEKYILTNAKTISPIA